MRYDPLWLLIYIIILLIVLFVWFRILGVVI